MSHESARLRDITASKGTYAVERAPDLPDVGANSVELTGRLTHDPELRTLADGSSVCLLRLAVERMGRGAQVGFIDVQAFGQTARVCDHVLSTGWIVTITGRLQYGQWLNETGDISSGHSVDAQRVQPVRLRATRPTVRRSSSRPRSGCYREQDAA